jgi:hypothetical protein
MTAASEPDDDYLTEIVRKSSVGIGAFTAERIILAGVAYVITATLGAASYGFFAVFTRGEVISRNLVAGIGDGYTRTIPQLSTSARRTILSVGTIGFVTVWVVVAAVAVISRDMLVDVTLLKPRHEGVVVLFAVGLLPFVLLRNLRDMFRALRRIKIAMLVSRISVPLALLAGAVFVVLAGGRSLFVVWAGVVGVAFVLLTAGVVILRRYTEVGFWIGSVTSAGGSTLSPVFGRHNRCRGVRTHPATRCVRCDGTVSLAGGRRCVQPLDRHWPCREVATEWG